MSVEIQGDEKLIVDMETFGARFNAQMPAITQQCMNDIIVYARHHHDFTTRTGKLEGSVDGKANALGFEVYLNPDQITTNKSFNYGVAIHNGTKYIDADPFLMEAFELKEEEINDTIGRAIWDILIDNI